MNGKYNFNSERGYNPSRAINHERSYGGIGRIGYSSLPTYSRPSNSPEKYANHEAAIIDVSKIPRLKFRGD